MYAKLAEAWNWTPEQVSALTPDQLLILSGESSNQTTGGPIQVHGQADMLRWAAAWEAVHSEEAKYRRGLKRMERELARRATRSPGLLTQGDGLL